MSYYRQAILEKPSSDESIKNYSVQCLRNELSSVNKPSRSKSNKVLLQNEKPESIFITVEKQNIPKLQNIT